MSQVSEAFLIPPNDLDSEGIVLAAILLDSEALDRVQPILKTQDFYSDANRWVYEAITSSSASGKPIDAVAVAGWLRDRDRLDQIGGTPYLAQLTATTPFYLRLEEHARRIVDKSRLRKVISEARAITAEAYTVGDQVSEFVQSAESRLFAVAEDLSRASTLRSLREVMVECVKDTTDARYNRIPAGASTGFRALDRRLGGGLKPGRMYVCAGRPGSGKTSFLTQVSKTVATSNAEKRGVFIASIEMPSKQIGDRFITQEMAIDSRCVESGIMTRAQWSQYLNTAEKQIAKWPIVMDDFPSLSISELRSSLRRGTRELERLHRVKLGLIGIDYLQLMGSPGRFQNENDRLSQITASIVGISKEFSVPVMLLSQLNRDCEKRDGKRPVMSDLRGSGSIEQDAHTIIFFHRDDVYRKSDESKDRSAEFIVSKCRGGRTGTVRLSYLEYCTKFIDEPDDDPADQYAKICEEFDSFVDEPERAP